MIKIGRNIFVGLCLVIILLFAASVAASSITQAENKKPALPTSAPTSDFSKIYKEALLSPLVKAGSEIKDPNIAQFYQKLVQAYELDKIPENSSSNEPAGLADLVPDIKKINKAALDLTLKEAGKQIKDKEIAEFYSGFLKQIGVDK